MTHPKTQHFWELVKSLSKSVSLIITCNILNLGVGHTGKRNTDYLTLLSLSVLLLSSSIDSSTVTQRTIQNPRASTLRAPAPWCRQWKGMDSFPRPQTLPLPGRLLKGAACLQIKRGRCSEAHRFIWWSSLLGLLCKSVIAPN